MFRRQPHLCPILVFSPDRLLQILLLYWAFGPMRPAGLEPATSWFEATRSIQLRYGRSNEPKKFYRQITSGETVR